MCAGQNGHLEVVKELIHNRANVNALNNVSYYIIILIVVIIILTTYYNIYILQGGRTPLHIASHLGHLEVVEELIKNGAELNKIDECVSIL